MTHKNIPKHLTISKNGHYDTSFAFFRMPRAHTRTRACEPLYPICKTPHPPSAHGECGLVLMCALVLCCVFGYHCIVVLFWHFVEFTLSFVEVLHFVVFKEDVVQGEGKRGKCLLSDCRFKFAFPYRDGVPPH